MLVKISFGVITHNFIDVLCSDESKLVYFLGYIDEDPVAVATLCLTEVAGLYGVATVNAQRNKGFCLCYEYCRPQLRQKKEVMTPVFSFVRTT